MHYDMIYYSFKTIDQDKRRLTESIMIWEKMKKMIDLPNIVIDNRVKNSLNNRKDVFGILLRWMTRIELKLNPFLLAEYKIGCRHLYSLLQMSNHCLLVCLIACLGIRFTNNYSKKGFFFLLIYYVVYYCVFLMFTFFVNGVYIFTTKKKRLINESPLP